jgi:malate synthase
MADWDLPTYLNTLSEPLLQRLASEAIAAEGVPGLALAPDLATAFTELQSTEALKLVVDVYNAVKADLKVVLSQRVHDRAFIDERTALYASANQGVDYHDLTYATVIGDRDSAGRLVVGPSDAVCTGPAVDIPDFLKGPTVTLFGPPDDPKMCIHAMNALHRIRPDEAPIVAELVDASGIVPRWGADSEDSKTPFIGDLLAATENLRHCYDASLSFTDPKSGKSYELASDRLSIPVKRVPGIALPDAGHLLNGNPLPLHLVDLVLHSWHNRGDRTALTFYVPKLENEEEAAYFASLVRVTEAEIAKRDPSFTPGVTRLFVVFETPRAIFRIREMADALHPYFAGGSLGWHDFLAATARLFKHDPNYRIPVKADPNIVIHHIKESHVRLAEALDPIGAIKIGGMYGTLFEEGNAKSFQVSMVGYIRDVVTQLRRGLDGFWVAHPDFVRIGIALVEAFRRRMQDPDDDALHDVVGALVPDPVELGPLLNFIDGEDVHGLDEDDPLYPRRLLAADIVHSDVITNSDTEEVRYNVFQALQSIAAWLSGTGCVALPAAMTNQRGESVFVRVMDDLATTERSRWELWAEVAHGRISVADFDAVLAEEIAFIKAGQPDANRRVQVPWSGESGRWYPVAVHVLRQLVTSTTPVESVSDLLLPFTTAPIRQAEHPLSAAQALCPGRYDR